MIKNTAIIIGIAQQIQANSVNNKDEIGCLSVQKTMFCSCHSNMFVNVSVCELALSLFAKLFILLFSISSGVGQYP